MINPVSVNTSHALNNIKHANISFKGDDDFETIDIDMPDDSFETEEKSVKEDEIDTTESLKQSKKELEELIGNEETPNAFKGILKLGAVFASGLIAGIAFKATLPEAVKTVKKMAGPKVAKENQAIAKTTTSFFKKLSDNTANMLEAQKLKFKPESKAFKAIQRAEDSVKNLQTKTIDNASKIKKGALDTASTAVGVSTGVETYQEMKTAKEEN